MRTNNGTTKIDFIFVLDRTTTTAAAATTTAIEQLSLLLEFVCFYLDICTCNGNNNNNNK